VATEAEGRPRGESCAAMGCKGAEGGCAAMGCGGDGGGTPMASPGCPPRARRRLHLASENPNIPFTCGGCRGSDGTGSPCASGDCKPDDGSSNSNALFTCQEHVPVSALSPATSEQSQLRPQSPEAGAAPALRPRRAALPWLSGSRQGVGRGLNRSSSAPDLSGASTHAEGTSGRAGVSNASDFEEGSVGRSGGRVGAVLRSRWQGAGRVVRQQGNQGLVTGTGRAGLGL